MSRFDRWLDLFSVVPSSNSRPLFLLIQSSSLPLVPFPSSPFVIFVFCLYLFIYLPLLFPLLLLSLSTIIIIIIIVINSENNKNNDDKKKKKKKKKKEEEEEEEEEEENWRGWWNEPGNFAK